MTVNTTWVDPTGATLDLSAGGLVGETNWDAVVSNTYRLGGTDGNAKTGKYQIGSTQAFSNANMAQGLTINQDAQTDEILALKSTGQVAHGATSITETDTFLYAKKVSGSDGGCELAALNDNGTSCLRLKGIAVTENSTRSIAGTAPVELIAGTKSGTTAVNPAANVNVVAIRLYDGTTRFIFDSDGDSHEDGTGWTAYDDYDDVALITSVEAQLSRDPLRAEFLAWATYNRAALERARLVTFNADGRHFVNRSRMQAALCGAVRQLAARLAALEQPALPATTE